MEQVVDELHKPARKRFPRRYTVLKGINDTWQIVLAEFIPYSNSNKGYNFFVINCFTKYLWTAPLKSKTGREVSDGMERLLRAVTTPPSNIQSDNGTEFYNSHFKQLMRKFNMNHYSTFSVINVTMVERIIRTIKTKMYKCFVSRGTYIWYDKLDEITREYYNTEHSVTKMRPNDVKSGAQAKYWLQTIYSLAKIVG